MTQQKEAMFDSLEVVQGVFDADGSFEAKVYCGTKKTISFHVNIIFSQKKEEEGLLEVILDILGSSNSVSEREIQNESGTVSVANSISLALSSDAGQLLHNRWKQDPPKASTKLLDYRISEILYKVAESKKTTALDVVNQILPELNLENERIASLALLKLRFQMYGKIKDSKNPNLNDISEYYERVKATPKEIKESILIFQLLYEPIKQEYEKSKTNFHINISSNYLVGYHIGDGSFWIQSVFPKPNSFTGKFFWSLTDCKDNKSLLLSIRNKLQSKNAFSSKKREEKGEEAGYYQSNTDNSCRLEAFTYNDCLIISEFLKEGMEKLPNLRKKQQFLMFSKALKLYKSENFKTDINLLKEFIRISWSINPATNFKRKRSLDQDLELIKIYFIERKKNRK